MENIGSALILTLIGMSVIFIVLILLLFVIIALNKVFPYVAPAPKPATKASGPGDDGETVAVIQAAITSYLRRKKG